MSQRATAWSLIRPYALLAAVVAATSLVGFAVVAAAEVALLTDPDFLEPEAGAAAAVGGVALLVADIVLPVPSSLVMVAHGALFGVIAGTALSLIGRVGAALAGGVIGRRSRRLLATTEDSRAEALVQRWGALAVVATRPVPVLAEAVAVAAGATGMRWSRLAAAAVLGALPEALLYALAGSVAATFGNTALVFCLLAVVTAVGWWLWLRRAAVRVEPAT